MAGSIKTGPITKEYAAGFDRGLRGKDREVVREVRPHDCEHCGKHMEYADQECACLSRDPWKH